MSDVEWFDRRAGDVASQGADDEHLVLVGDIGVSDWVRLPPELGALQLRVVEVARRYCPQCRTAARWLLLQERYGVAECRAGCGFVWFRRREQ